MSTRARFWPACSPTRKLRTEWCTSSCRARLARSKLPAMCRGVPWWTPWKNCGACRVAEGFGENKFALEKKNMPETAQQDIQRILGHVEGQDAIKVQRTTVP